MARFVVRETTGWVITPGTSETSTNAYGVTFSVLDSAHAWRVVGEFRAGFKRNPDKPARIKAEAERLAARLESECA